MNLSLDLNTILVVIVFISNILYYKYKIDNLEKKIEDLEKEILKLTASNILLEKELEKMQDKKK
jgi:cell division protein FtsB